MARDLALEQGKPLAEAVIEITVAAEMFEAAAEDAKRLNGEVLQSADTTRQIFVHRVPLGVVGIITPWNFPVTIRPSTSRPAWPPATRWSGSRLRPRP
jgi:succinate-semialdehyde dehydrogenase/glutarate-semialdehyde dehydrogenase